jgi:hypothetical protein
MQAVEFETLLNLSALPAMTQQKRMNFSEFLAEKHAKN